MSFIYSAFAIILSVTIITNIFIKRSEAIRDIYSNSIAWSINGVPYLLVLIVLNSYGAIAENLFYLFQVMASMGFIWFFYSRESIQGYVPKGAPLGIVIFITAWMVMGSVTDMTRFAVLLPSALVLSGVSLMISTYFFLGTDKEIQLEGVIGILFAIMTVTKFLYMTIIDDQQANFFMDLFALDFNIYCFIAALFFFNGYYRKMLMSLEDGRVISELLTSATGPVAILNKTGQIVFSNNHMKMETNEQGEDLQDLQDILELYVPEKQKDWTKKAIEGFEEGKGCIFPLNQTRETSIEQSYFSCDVLPGKESYHILFSLRTYPAKGFWTGDQEREQDRLLSKTKEGQWLKAFEEAISDDGSEKVGIILIHITEYANILGMLGEELHGDFIAGVRGNIKITEGISHVSHYEENRLIVLTEAASLEHIQNIVESLHYKLMKQYKLSDFKINLMPEFGIAVYPDNGSTFGEVFRAAQIALARNTVASGDVLQFYDYQQKYRRYERIILENKLRHATENNEFHLVYQPQMDAHNHSLRGFEALIRWEWEDGTTVSPNSFIPLAENIGVMDDIGNWVFVEAISQAAKWQKEFGKNFIISINVSYSQLEKPNFVYQLLKILKKYDYNPYYLELEFADNKHLKASRDVYVALKAIRSLGVRIALDEDNVAYGSLDYFRWLSFDVMKIDKFLIEHINKDTVEQQMLFSIIDLMDMMDFEIVAEGVEKTEQLKLLEPLAGIYIQGDLFSKPLEAFDAREFLLEMD